MRTVFDTKLNELHRDLIELGVLVSRAIEKSVHAFNENDTTLADEVIQEDTRINNKQHKIDEASQQLIAMQQPNAKDLRRIISVIRAASNLERMADHAKNIAEALDFIHEEERNGEPEDLIQQMSDKVLDMSRDMIDAFINFDVHYALEIAARDKDVDKLYNELRFAAVAFIREHPESVDTASQYSFIGMDLERIGDYITNIAEELVYLDTGEVIDLN